MEQQTIPFNLEYFRAGNKAFVKKEYSGERTIQYTWVADTQRTDFVVVLKSFEETPGSGLWEEQYFAIEIKALENHTYMHPPVFYTAIDRRFGIFLTREEAENRKDALFTIGPDAVIVSLSQEQYQAIQEEMNKTE